MTRTQPRARSGSHRWLERSARLSWRIVLGAIALGIVAGTLTATTNIGGEQGTWPSPEYRPPLFFVMTSGLYALGILLSLPSLLAAFPTLAGQDWRRGAYHLLHGLAPVLIFAGFSEGSHHIGCVGLTWLCPGGDFTGQVHLLHHTLVAALPLAVLFECGLLLAQPRPGGQHHLAPR